MPNYDDDLGGNRLSQMDFIVRQIEQNYATQQRAIDDIQRLLSGFTSQQIAAFDLAGVPSAWDVLTRRAGSWRGILLPLRPYQVYDASSGTTPKIGVIPSTTTDAVHFFNPPWTPTIDGNPINVPIGMPPAYPLLTIDPAATVAYTHATIDSSGGAITAIAVEADTGGGFPNSTATDWYMLLTTLAVTFSSGGNAIVTVQNNGWFGPILYSTCAVLPLTDGSGYIWGN